MCTQPVVRDRRAPGERGQQSDNYFWYKWKILTGILWWWGPTAEDRGVRRKSVNLVGLWETVTLCHTLLALEVCMWATNKTGGRECCQAHNLSLGSVCVRECVWRERGVEPRWSQNSLSSKCSQAASNLVFVCCLVQSAEGETMSASWNKTDTTDHSSSINHCRFRSVEGMERGEKTGATGKGNEGWRQRKSVGGKWKMRRVQYKEYEYELKDK